MRTVRISALAIGCMLAAAGARAQGTPPGDVAAGRQIAETHCSRCHVVGDYNTTGGIMSTPSFQLLVNALDDYRVRFATFYLRRPHPVFIRIKGFPPPNDLPPNAAPVEIELDDIADLVAFAETLKKNGE